jgi:hypothetical protein
LPTLLEKKTSEALSTSEVFALDQHPHRLFEVFRHIVPVILKERLHELGRFGPITDAMIDRDGYLHATRPDELKPTS